MLVRSPTSAFRLLIKANTKGPLLLRLARHSSNLPTPSSPDDLQLQPKKPPVPHHKINRFPVEYHGVLPTTFNSDTLWLPIFKFPFVVACNRIITFKLYLTLFSMGVCTYKVYTYLLVDPNVSFKGILLLFAISTYSLLYVSDIARRLICQIYTTEDLQYIRFCRYSAFGHRRDLILPTCLVKPLTETNDIVGRSFLNLEFIKPEELDLDNDFEEFYEEPFKVSLRFGGVLDPPRLEQTLGKILSRKY